VHNYVNFVNMKTIEYICLNSIQPASPECETCRREYLETGVNGKACFVKIKLTTPQFPRTYKQDMQNIYFS